MCTCMYHLAEHNKRVVDLEMRITSGENPEKELKQYVDKRGYINIKFIGQTENIQQEIKNFNIVSENRKMYNLILKKCIFN